MTRPCASLNWYEPGASGMEPAGGRCTTPFIVRATGRHGGGPITPGGSIADSTRASGSRWWPVLQLTRRRPPTGGWRTAPDLAQDGRPALRLSRDPAVALATVVTFVLVL